MKAPVQIMWKKGKSMQHLVSGCKKLAQKKHKRRHDNVSKKVHWNRCKKNGLEHTEKWYEHVPEGAAENEEVKVLWDIFCRKKTRHKEKERKEKEREKVEKYQDLKREIRRLWRLKMVEVVPEVLEAFGSVTKEFDGWIKKLQITNNVGVMQKTTLFATARILRKKLEM